MSPYRVIWKHGDGSQTVLCFMSCSWALTCKFAIERDNANEVIVLDCNDKELK